MNQLSLSIEELIYCFYSEGFFEQGNALKQVYFGDLDDEKMDLLLQITCRSLLAKNVLSYKDHKFTLIPELSEVISILNFSELSIKGSRHSAAAEEESLSFHFGKNRIIQHVLQYDEQVHTFTSVELDEVSRILGEFYHVGTEPVLSDSSCSLTQEEFEELLSILEDNNKQFDRPTFHGEKELFYRILKETNGLLNTLLFLEFNDQKEPVAKNVVMFTNKQEQNWQIEKTDGLFNVKPCNQSMIQRLLEENVMVYQKR
ncbi:hypothetical protein [Neobacillus dielmonensis]|uniref:hypothetical protein n=1 Tax=Neobacillus dielmonensis TaxID=1347369 RepID=UPI000694DA5A|nr:hypothetical protein [Neobacillus dielmonensis]